MLKGREIHVLAVDGQLRLCTCLLDRKLKTLTIEMNGLERKARGPLRGSCCSAERHLVLSGARQAEDSLAYDGQDPEDFLRNAQDFFDELSWHYRKGSYKDVCLADALRDRSSRPKTMEDLRRSVEYSILAPGRTREEQLE